MQEGDRQERCEQRYTASGRKGSNPGGEPSSGRRFRFASRRARIMRRKKGFEVLEPLQIEADQLTGGLTLCLDVFQAGARPFPYLPVEHFNRRPKSCGTASNRSYPVHDRAELVQTLCQRIPISRRNSRALGTQDLKRFFQESRHAFGLCCHSNPTD